MIKRIPSLRAYDYFIDSFLDDPDYSDPHLSARKEAGEDIEDMVTREDHVCFGVMKDSELTGLFVLLILPEENYLEMLMGITRDPEAVEELLDYLKKEYRGYLADFVFNPRHRLLKEGLAKRGAEFDTEQQKMVYTHVLPACGTDDIELLSPPYEKQYCEMHTKDMYWTAERVIRAPERFRTFVAVKDGTLIGYLDVDYCFEENEPFDLLVKPEYRRKGYGRRLLAKALLENEPKDMMLLVEVDNTPAIALYQSMGFVKKENANMLTVHWRIPA